MLRKVVPQEEDQLRRIIERLERLVRRLRVSVPMSRARLIQKDGHAPSVAAQQVLDRPAWEILDPGVLQLLILIALDTLTSVITPAGLASFKTFFVNATNAGDTEVVERVEGKKIAVRGYMISNRAASVATVRFRSGSRAICADKDLAADGGGAVVAPLSRGYWFETSVGETLNINLDAAGTIGVDVIYDEVEPNPVGKP